MVEVTFRTQSTAEARRMKDPPLLPMTLILDFRRRYLRGSASVAWMRAKCNGSMEIRIATRSSDLSQRMNAPESEALTLLSRLWSGQPVPITSSPFLGWNPLHRSEGGSPPAADPIRLRFRCFPSAPRCSQTPVPAPTRGMLSTRKLVRSFASNSMCGVPARHRVNVVDDVVRACLQHGLPATIWPDIAP